MFEEMALKVKGQNDFHFYEANNEDDFFSDIYQYIIKIIIIFSLLNNKTLHLQFKKH